MELRTIKFRGMYHNGEGWHYGQYVSFAEDESNYADHYIYTGKRDLAYGSGTCWNVGERVSVKPETVGQFTGLTDKNGKEIYEGDVVKIFATSMSESSWIAKVEWGLMGFSLCAITTGGTRTKGSLYGYYREPIAVLGNIYEQPALLNS